MFACGNPAVQYWPGPEKLCPSLSVRPLGMVCVNRPTPTPFVAVKSSTESHGPNVVLIAVPLNE